MRARSQALADADDFLRRMKNGEALIRERVEKSGFTIKRNADWETDWCTDWHMKYMTLAEERRKRLENEPLSIEDLIEESEDQLLEAFAYFLCLTPEQQARTAQQFKDGLERVKALREVNRERARRMLERQGVRYG